MIYIQNNEADPELRQMVFYLSDPSYGGTPVNTEDGGQPQINICGRGWVNSTGKLVFSGDGGKYYLILSQAEVNQKDRAVIEGRYKSSNTAEAVGETVQICNINGLVAIPAVKVGTGLLV